ncbi:MAG: hypothetical protein PHC70_00150 [Patescibacteria group bacterium]|nr:hypothetical protein [Patescibacteria group bacterium]
MPRNKLLIICALLPLLAAGCGEPVNIPKVAEPFGPPEGKGSAAQHLGFGVLPKLEMPAGLTQGNLNVKTDLPILQPTVTILRLPSGNLNLTEFQNLTQAIGLPAGLVGDETQNLGYTLTWTNKEGIIWQFFSNDRRITFNNPKAKPKLGVADSWLGKNQLIDKVDIFLKLHGVDEQKLKNIQIVPSWSQWMDKLDQTKGCSSPILRNQVSAVSGSDKMFDQFPPSLPGVTSTNCVASYPSALPVIFERLVDGWNILDKYGQPEEGGQIMVNAATGEMISGWMTLPVDPHRSDYPAITNNDLVDLLEKGGLIGPLPGTKEITSYSFGFVRLPKTQAYDYEYLSPALIAEATRLTEKGPEPYRIVVPLIKQ